MGGSKKSSPVKAAAKTATVSLQIMDENSEHSLTSTPSTSHSQLPVMILCKHLSSMSDFLKMYHLVARHLHWGKTIRVCSECQTSTPPLHACLQCPHFSCGSQSEHFLRHNASSGHGLSIETLSGVVYCAVCKVWIWNDLLAEVWNEARISSVEKSSIIRLHDAIQTWNNENNNNLAMGSNYCGSVRGLWNLGNTCFMNSILQTMLHTAPLWKYFLSSSGPFHVPQLCRRFGEGFPCIACEIDHLFCKMYDGNLQPLAPSKMLESLWKTSRDMAGYEQQDAHELFVTLRNALHTHLEGAMFNCTCVIHKIFSGVLQSDVTCLQCKNVTETFDPFLDISLDVPTGGNAVDLQDCLLRFTKSEHLPAGNYACPSCNQNQSEVAKQLTIRAYPQVLSIHLKRFEHGVSSTKIDTPIHFQETLSIAPYLAPSVALQQTTACNYHLFAVVSHVGNLDSGHYTSFVKNRGDWFWIDDACVVSCNTSNVVQSNAYMLFYQRAEEEKGEGDSFSNE